MRIERWAFTERELKDPTKCTADDDFLAFPGDDEDGVWVDRRGVSLGGEQIADEEDVLYRYHDYKQLGEAYCWRDVQVDLNGNFIMFVRTYL